MAAQGRKTYRAGAVCGRIGARSGRGIGRLPWVVRRVAALRLPIRRKAKQRRKGREEIPPGLPLPTYSRPSAFALKYHGRHDCPAPSHSM